MSDRDTKFRKIRVALIGGGFIGKIHALAATMDGRAELVAGALSSEPERARRVAADFGIAEHRAYPSFRALMSGEQARLAEDRVDLVVIATPNATHFEIAGEAIAAGFHVMCDKPLTVSVEQARRLAELASESRSRFAVMHNYTGYPSVRHARQLVRDGELGQVQAVRVHYLQGGQRRVKLGEPPTFKAWKVDPQQTGPSGTMADIGTHAFNLLRFVTGLEVEAVSCTLRRLHPVRPLDDYGHALLQLQDGAIGAITVSQVTHGRLNDLWIEVDGTEASLIWRQECPNRVELRRHAEPIRIFERDPRAGYLPAAAYCRLPAGHPEGFLEAFANVYGSFFDDILRDATGLASDASGVYPGLQDGLEGVLFVDRCLASNAAQGAWRPFESS